jgi:serralysin
MTLFVQTSIAQISLSSGPYSQNFNTLANSSSGNTNWADNAILAGWYAAQKSGGAVTNYRVSTGSSTTGALYSFGANGDADRALGSQAGGAPSDFAFGIRFTNNTADILTNFTLSYIGEQWRRANTTTQTIAFSYCVATGAITNADVTGTLYTWVPFSALDFQNPNSGSSTSLDGNDATNRLVFASVLLSNIAVLPGQELFLRWLDSDDTGFDHGLAIDDLAVTFSSLNGNNGPAPIPLNIELLGSATVLTWTNPAFILQAAGMAEGIYTNVPGAMSPYTNGVSEPQRFFRLKAN